jgi:hypothetical protein
MFFHPSPPPPSFLFDSPLPSSFNILRLPVFEHLALLSDNSVSDTFPVHSPTLPRISGGHGTFSNLVNNIVHIIMYFYYMLSAMGPQYQKYLWWKKHLTLLQLVSSLGIRASSFCEQTPSTSSYTRKLALLQRNRQV